MSYMHIENLYKNQNILMFKQCYAMEKIHGTSAHVMWKKGKLSFFSGGSKHEHFVALFNQEQLAERFNEVVGETDCVVYGEAYGGKLQGMRDTYGDQLKFICFEVKINDCWLEVPKAEDVVSKLGLEFVHWKQVPTDLAVLDAERDSPSIQAARNGCGSDKPREGIVLRPLIELTTKAGNRIIAKHKAAQFSETKTPREVDPEKIRVLAEAKAIAEEWVTRQRLSHVLDAGNLECRAENIGKIIPLMMEDILREAEGEIVDSPSARKEISRATALLVKGQF